MRQEHTDKIRAMRLAIYNINAEVINKINSLQDVEETLHQEAKKIEKIIENDDACLSDIEWVTDALTQQCYDLETLSMKGHAA